jgi:hypothetical protein
MSIEFVAEHIMGYERKRCQGSMGGGTANADGSGESFFWCDWCGQRMDYSKAGPCPKYPFPSFTLIDLMARLGEKGIPTVVRFDTLRKTGRFTIIGPEGRICNTDHPLDDFCEYLAKRYGGDN